MSWPRAIFRVCSVLVVLSGPAAYARSLVPVKLRCEYAANPLGIDEPRPRLSWQFKGSGRAQRQTAYEVTVAATADDLAAGRNLLWDSGKVASAQSTHVPYGG